MRYIDKYKRHDKAHTLNVRYLKSLYARNPDVPDPSPAEGERSFASFKRFKKDWKALLFEEQTFEGECRCCYCMRKIDENKGESGIEHIIPKSLSGDEGDRQYIYYSSQAPALRDHVMMADEFSRKKFTSNDEIEKEARMPHTTALSNLVVSCNGNGLLPINGCRCNNIRGKDMMMPIMLMQNAETDVRYDANGLVIISCNDGTLDQIREELNTDTLKEIRSIWYHLSRVNRNVADARFMTKTERIEWFKQAYCTDNFASLPSEIKRYSSIFEPGNQDTYWKLLLSYDWFYYKYRNS